MSDEVPPRQSTAERGLDAGEWFEEEHDCSAEAVCRIDNWLVREKLTGLHPEAARAIERMIEDLR